MPELVKRDTRKAILSRHFHDRAGKSCVQIKVFDSDGAYWPVYDRQYAKELADEIYELLGLVPPSNSMEIDF